MEICVLESWPERRTDARQTEKMRPQEKVLGSSWHFRWPVGLARDCAPDEPIRQSASDILFQLLDDELLFGNRFLDHVANGNDAEERVIVI